MTEQTCPICGSDNTYVWWGSGYAKLVCGDCGATLDDDPFNGLDKMEVRDDDGHN